VYAPLPLLLWACLRFGPGGLSFSAIAISLIAFRCVLAGRGPFASPLMLENVLFLQILLLIVILPLILLTAVLSERQNTEKELQKSRARLIHSQEEERRHIARELHDDITQQLALISVEMQRIAQSPTDVPDALKSSLVDLRRQVEAASASTRSLSHGLHPAHLEILGLVPALRSFCSELQNQTGMTIAFTEKEIPRELDRDASLALFRVAQEAINNVVKHSHAKNVQVQLTRQKEWLLLKIVDDGVGFTAGNLQSPGLGVINMKDRIESLAGRLEITTEPGHGTVIEAWVPCHSRQPGGTEFDHTPNP
jgi:signal transduction histidine kinase